MTAHLAATFQTIGASVEYRANLQEAWALAVQEVADHLLFIPHHSKVIREKDERLSSGKLVHRPDTVAQSIRLHAERVVAYLGALRRLHSLEAEMNMLGVPFALSSDDWES